MAKVQIKDGFCKKSMFDFRTKYFSVKKVILYRGVSYCDKYLVMWKKCWNFAA